MTWFVIRNDDPTGAQQLFYVAVAETEAEAQPDAMTDDLGRKSIVCVRVGSGGGVHRSSQDGLLI